MYKILKEMLPSSELQNPDSETQSIKKKIHNLIVALTQTQSGTQFNSYIEYKANIMWPFSLR